MRYIQDCVEDKLQGDVYTGHGFRPGWDRIPRIYIGIDAKIRNCSITRNNGKGKIIQHLLKNLDRPFDRKTLAGISNLNISTIPSYMIDIAKGFSQSLWYELVYDFGTKTYALKERQRWPSHSHSFEI
ncbi:hypothetical protein FJZ18_00900 [Candidatus Pacearchaeota archaeon]|nr:hypothetical protein [Candidatus Pacearchaeota archaeon]